MNTRHKALITDSLECLDDRLVLSAIHPMGPQPIAPTAQVVHTAAVTYTPNGTAMDKAGQTLNIIYREFAAYQQKGSQGTFVSSQSGRVVIANGYVGVDIRVSGDVNAVVGQMKQLGMVVTNASAQFGLIEGSLPIGQIPAAANDAFVVGMSPVFKPILS